MSCGATGGEGANVSKWGLQAVFCGAQAAKAQQTRRAIRAAKSRPLSLWRVTLEGVGRRGAKWRRVSNCAPCKLRAQARARHSFRRAFASRPMALNAHCQRGVPSTRSTNHPLAFRSSSSANSEAFFRINNNIIRSINLISYTY